MPYLAELTMRLLAGVALLDPLRRQHHAAFLARLQNSDGGFPGRQGPSNPYYTSFALRGLALAGGLSGRVADRAAEYLRHQVGRSLALVDQLSVVFAASVLEGVAGAKGFVSADELRRWVVASLEGLRRPDGGYAKAPHSPASSTYCTFLAVVALELLGVPLGARQPLVDLVRSRQRPDGGFVELEAMRHGGTNPTAAAVAILRLLDAWDTPSAERAVRFLWNMQSPEGGFCAHSRIVVADLLSTFTALAALGDLGAMDRLDTEAVRRYIARCECAGGGFGSGWQDPSPDAEYTFYGLAAEALLLSAGH